MIRLSWLVNCFLPGTRLVRKPWSSRDDVVCAWTHLDRIFHRNACRCLTCRDTLFFWQKSQNSNSIFDFSQLQIDLLRFIKCHETQSWSIWVRVRRHDLRWNPFEFIRLHAHTRLCEYLVDRYDDFHLLNKRYFSSVQALKKYFGKPSRQFRPWYRPAIISEDLHLVFQDPLRLLHSPNY